MSLAPRFPIVLVLTAASTLLFVSCDSRTAQSASGEANHQEISEYKIVRMYQKDDKTWVGSLEAEFQIACGELLKEGWLPAGNVTIHYKDADSWRTPMAFTQAFYR